MENVDIELSDEQHKAIRSLERAFKKCKDANIYFHNCYGTLTAYDGNIVDFVNDDPSEFPCGNGYPITSSYDSMNLVSWADDKHYIHLKLFLKGLGERK